MGTENVQSVYINALAPGGAWPVVDASGSDAPAPQFVAQDKFEFRAYFLDVNPATGVATAASFDAGSIVMLAVKATRLSASATLASVQLTYNAGGYWTGTLSFAGTSALAAVASGSPVRVWVDVQVSNPGGTVRTTWQFSTKLSPQAYYGEGAAEADPDPVPTGRTLMSGEMEIPIGAGVVDVVLSEAADNTGYSVTAVVVKPTSGSPDILVSSVYGRATTGFSIAFSSPPETGGYYVSYIIV